MSKHICGGLGLEMLKHKSMKLLNIDTNFISRHHPCDFLRIHISGDVLLISGHVGPPYLYRVMFMNIYIYINIYI